jgi:hypothetical protein
MTQHTQYKCTQPCEKLYCQFCEGGLFACTICPGFEGSLTAECPGPQTIPEVVADLVWKDLVDFKDGFWTPLPKLIEVVAMVGYGVIGFKSETPDDIKHALVALAYALHGYFSITSQRREV